MRVSSDTPGNSIEALLERELGLPLQDVRAMSEGTTGEVYAARLAERDVFVRVDVRDRGIDVELAVLAAYAQARVPVPELMYADFVPVIGHSVLVEGCVPGVQLSKAGLPPDDERRVYAAAGRMLGTIHGIRVMDGFGLARVRDGVLCGRRDTWGEAVEYRRALRPPEVLRDAGILDEGECDRVRQAYDRVAAVIPEHILLHGDFHSQHLFTDGEGVSGVIDFDRATVGDPRFDLGHAAVMQTPAQWEAFAGGYGDLALDQIVDDWKLVIVAGKVIWGMNEGRTDVLQQCVPLLVRLLRGPLIVY